MKQSRQSAHALPYIMPDDWFWYACRQKTLILTACVTCCRQLSTQSTTRLNTRRGMRHFCSAWLLAAQSCTAGLGRAPAVIIAYLFWFKGMGLDEVIYISHAADCFSHLSALSCLWPMSQRHWKESSHCFCAVAY